MSRTLVSRAALGLARQSRHLTRATNDARTGLPALGRGIRTGLTLAAVAPAHQMPALERDLRHQEDFLRGGHFENRAHADEGVESRL